MAYGDNDNRMNHAASRPPTHGGTGEELFTEIPLTPRRTQSGGRPVNYPEQNPYSIPRPDVPPVRRTAEPVRPSGARFTDLSRGTPRSDGREKATFTEISWNSLYPGEQTAQPVRFTPPPAEETPRPTQPVQGFRPTVDDYARMPAPRQSRRGAEETFVDPFREVDPTAYDRTVPVRPTANNAEIPPEPVKTARFTAPAPTAAPIARPRADFNRPASPRTAARHASPAGAYTPSNRPYAPPARSYAPPVIPEADSGLPIEAWQTRPRPTVKKRGIHPAFYVIGALLAFLVILGISKGVKAIRNNSSPKEPKASTATAAPTAKITPATPDPAATPTPEPTPTPAPTPTPSGAKAVNTGTCLAPADWGCVLWPREKDVYDSFFDNSCMIGNSLVEGFFMYSGLSNIKYIYNTGAVINKVFGYLDLYPLEVNTYDNIYLMFGLNEVGSDVESFISNYNSLLDYIREHQPSANIIIVSVTPVTKGVDEDPNEAQSMERIRLFNDRLQQLCKEKGCWYLDIFSMLLDGEGYLSSDYAYAGDGKHFEKSGYVAWANYMKSHYVDDGLLK